MWQFDRAVFSGCHGATQKTEQNSDNWCISSTNYPRSAPLSNWSFLYFTIFAVFPFPFVYLSPLFRVAQWAARSLYRSVLARVPPLNLLRNSSELPDEQARFFWWLIWARITFCFFGDRFTIGSIGRPTDCRCVALGFRCVCSWIILASIYDCRNFVTRNITIYYFKFTPFNGSVDLLKQFRSQIVSFIVGELIHS